MPAMNQFASHSISPSFTTQELEALDAPKASIDVSFIIPVYNEVENVDALIREVAQTGYRLKRSFEIVIVDDGSRDGTVAALKPLTQEFPQLNVVCLKRNY